MTGSEESNDPNEVSAQESAEKGTKSPSKSVVVEKLITILRGFFASYILVFYKPKDAEGDSAPASSFYSRFRIGLIFEGIVPSLVFAVAFAFYGSQVLTNVTAEVIVYPPSLPQSIVSRGAGSESEILERAINSIPQIMEEYRASFSKKETLINLLQTISAGQERFCPQGDIGPSITLNDSYFRKASSKRILTNDELNENKLQLPGVGTVTNYIRILFGIKTVELHLEVHESTGGYELLSYIVPLSGYTGEGKPQKFITKILSDTYGGESSKYVGEAAERAITEGIMRVSYPEVTALALGTAGRSSLAIEEYIGSNYPTSDRSIAIDAGRLRALLIPSNVLRENNNKKRALYILRKMQHVVHSDLYTINSEYLTYIDTKFSAEIVGREVNDLVSHMSQAATDKWLKEMLIENDLDLGALENLETIYVQDQDEFELLYLYYWDSNISNYGIERIDKLGAQVISLVKAYYNANEESERRLAIRVHDFLILWATYIGTVVQSIESASVEPESSESNMLHTYIQFVEKEIQILHEARGIFNDEEMNYLESIFIGAELRLGATSDALERLERLSQAVKPCSGSALSYLIGGVNTKWIKEIAQNDAALYERLQDISGLLFRNAETGGLRFFQLYNAIGMSEEKLGNVEGAIEAFKKSLLYTGERPWALLNWGSLELRRGRPKDAAELFRKSLEESFQDCKREVADWSEIDEMYNSNMRSVFDSKLEMFQAELGMTKEQIDAALEISLISTTCTHRRTAIPNAVYGLLNSLQADEKPGEYIRVYSRYYGEEYSKINIQKAKEIWVQIKSWYCSGAISSIPEVPDSLAYDFPVKDGRLVCAVNDSQGTPSKKVDPPAPQ